jgi:hypothetical protein
MSLTKERCHELLTADESKVECLGKKRTKVSWVAALLIALTWWNSPQPAAKILETFKYVTTEKFGNRVRFDRMLMSRARRLAAIETYRDENTGQWMWVRRSREQQAA